MTDQIIIKTNSEDKALIPDKWILGTGLTTDGLYVVHTDSPFMMVQCQPRPTLMEVKKGGGMPCIVYLNGEIDPDTFNRLFAEAWKLLEIYKGRMNPSPIGDK